MVWKGEEKWRRKMTKILRRRKRGQTGTHADRHCEERARMLVSEFVIGQCVSRLPVEGYNIAKPLVCQLMCYKVQNPEPENMRHNIQKYETQVIQTYETKEIQKYETQEIVLMQFSVK